MTGPPKIVNAADGPTAQVPRLPKDTFTLLQDNYLFLQFIILGHRVENCLAPDQSRAVLVTRLFLIGTLSNYTAAIPMSRMGKDNLLSDRFADRLLSSLERSMKIRMKCV